MTDLREHSVYLHRERNGFTLRYYVDKETPARYVFKTADELMSFMVENFFMEGEFEESTLEDRPGIGDGILPGYHHIIFRKVSIEPLRP